MQSNKQLSKKKGALILRRLFQKNNLNNALEILNLKITCMRLHFHIFHVLWKTLLQFSTEVFIKALSIHIQREIGWWGGWVRWIVFMTSLYKYYALSLVLVEHSVGSNTNNVWTPLLAIHSWHVATKPLWWWRGWAHCIVFMTSLYI